MKIINITLLVILIISVKTSFAQDGVFKFKKVEISFAEINQNDSLLSLELYQNSVFSTNEPGIMGNRFNSNFDSITNTYTLYYSYIGIGGGTDNRLACPLLFVKLNFITEDNKEYFQLIPISLAICANSQIREIKVLNIDLNGMVKHFDKMVHINENEKYEIVTKEVINIDQLYKIE
jgi:hypothetical protein